MSERTKRVVVSSFVHEASSFSIGATSEHVRVREQPEPGSGNGRLMDGVFEVLRHQPGLRISMGAWVEVPAGSGPLDEHATAVVVDSVIGSVRRNQADAVVLQVHGASLFQECQATELMLLRSLREEIGPTAKVVVINDPHGNITPEWEDVAGALLSYKTTPHRDQRRTGRRAAQLLLGLLSASDSWDRPRVTRVPILLKGSLLSYTQPVVQSQPPFAQLRTKARELERKLGIQDISINPGQAACDSGQTGMSIVVNGWTEKSVADAVGQRLCAMAWQLRSRMDARAVLVAVGAAVAAALRREGCSYLVDEGNDPWAGAEGNRVEVLEALAKFGWPAANVCVTDPAGLERCRASGCGSDVALSLARGGLDSDLGKRPRGAPLLLKGRVKSISAGAAVLRQGGTDVVITSRQLSLRGPSVYEAAGVDVRGKRIIVVDPAARLHFSRFRSNGDVILSLDTYGASNPDVRRFRYTRVNERAYPLECLEDPPLTTGLGGHLR